MMGVPLMLKAIMLSVVASIKHLNVAKFGVLGHKEINLHRKFYVVGFR
jgi:hypothetical protein